MGYSFYAVSRCGAEYSVADNTTDYECLSGFISGGNTNGDTQSPFTEYNGDFSNGGIYVKYNDVGSASACTLYDDNSATALSISITASTTGLFENTANTVSVVAGSLMNWRIIVPSVGGTKYVKILHIFCRFIPSTNTIKRFMGGANTYDFADTTTRYLPFGESPDQVTTVEAKGQHKYTTAGTLKNGHFYTSTNSRSAAVLMTGRIGGVDTALVVSVTASTTGHFADTTHDVSISDGDLVSFSLSGTGTGTVNVAMVGWEFETTNNRTFAAYNGGTGLAYAAGATRRFSIDGSFYDGQGADSEIRTKLYAAATATKLQIYSSVNGATTNGSFTLYHNGGNSALTLSITAATTGRFEDTTHSVSIATTDTLSYVLVTGATASITISGWGMMLEDSTFSIPVLYDTIAMSENVDKAVTAGNPTASLNETWYVREDVTKVRHLGQSLSDNLRMSENLATRWSISWLTDNFDDNSIDGTKWGDVTAQVTETNNQIEITGVALSTTQRWLGTSTLYSLIGSSATVKIIDAGDTTKTGYAFYPLQLYTDSSNSIEWKITSVGNLEVNKNSSGWSNLFSATYVASTHRYLKMREASGTTYFDYSSDGVSWTNAWSGANPITLTGLQVYIQLNLGSNAVVTTVKVDDFNYLPAGAPNLNDTINVSENLSSAFILGATLFDTINVSENVTPLVTVLVQSLNETEYIKESVTPLVTVLVQSLNETEYIKENVTPLLICNQSVFDTVNISENVTPLIKNFAASVFDTNTVAENVTPLTILNASLFDTISEAELVTPLVPVLVQSVFDTLKESENVTPLIPVLVQSVFDSTSVAENVTPLIANFAISSYDILNVSEDVTPLITNLVASNEDTISVSDIASGYLGITQDLADVVNVSEDVTPSVSALAEDLTKDLGDDLTVSDDLSEQLNLAISLVDSIASSDNASEVFQLLLQDLADSLSIAEEVSPLIPVLIQQLVDDIRAGDYADSLVPFILQELFETITVGDNVSFEAGVLSSLIYDALTAADTIQNLQTWLNSVNDSVAVSDASYLDRKGDTYFSCSSTNPDVVDFYVNGDKIAVVNNV